jgi:hypothetical protein
LTLDDWRILLFGMRAILKNALWLLVLWGVGVVAQVPTGGMVLVKGGVLRPRKFFSVK